MRSFMSANQLGFLCIYGANRNDSSDTYYITQFCQCYTKLDVTPMGREMLLIPDGSCNDNAKATMESGGNPVQIYRNRISKKRRIPA
jgi:hypothetical protein